VVGRLSRIARAALVLGCRRSKLIGIALDSDTSLLPGKRATDWLERQITSLDPRVQVY